MFGNKLRDIKITQLEDRVDRLERPEERQILDNMVYLARVINGETLCFNPEYAEDKAKEVYEYFRGIPLDLEEEIK